MGTGEYIESRVTSGLPADEGRPEFSATMLDQLQRVGEWLGSEGHTSKAEIVASAWYALGGTPEPDLDWYVRKPNGLVDGPHPSRLVWLLAGQKDENLLSFPRGTRVSADGVPEGEWRFPHWQVSRFEDDHISMDIWDSVLPGEGDDPGTITFSKLAALELLKERVDAELSKGDTK